MNIGFDGEVSWTNAQSTTRVSYPCSLPPAILTNFDAWFSYTLRRIEYQKQIAKAFSMMPPAHFWCQCPRRILLTLA